MTWKPALHFTSVNRKKVVLIGVFDGSVLTCLFLGSLKAELARGGELSILIGHGERRRIRKSAWLIVAILVTNTGCTITGCAVLHLQVHHLKTDVALTSAKSSGSMGKSFGRTNGSSGGSSGRKSFRRSTSEDDLIRAAETEGIPAEDAPRDQSDDVSSGSCYHSNDFIMEEGSHEENEGFESTEMELFDEICAEIYGKEQHDVVASLGQREHDLEERRIELTQKPHSFLVSNRTLSVSDQFCKLDSFSLNCRTL